jgi:hypothetical protein
MKVKITEKGVYDNEGKPLDVGTEITVEQEGDDVPAWLLNKAEVIAEKPAKGVAVNNKAD